MNNVETTEVSIKTVKGVVFPAMAAGGAMWILAGIWHELLNAAFYSRDAHATHEGIGVILAAYLVLGVLMAVLYPKQYKGGHPIFRGLMFGVVIGVIWVFPHGLAMVGAHGESFLYVVKNSLWHLVEQGLGGVVLALIYDRMRRGRRLAVLGK